MLKRTGLVLLAAAVLLAAISFTPADIVEFIVLAFSDRSLDRKHTNTEEQIILGNAKQTGYEMPMEEKEAFAAWMIVGAKGEMADCTGEVQFEGIGYCGTFRAERDEFLGWVAPPFRKNLAGLVAARTEQPTILEMRRWGKVGGGTGSLRGTSLVIGGVQMVYAYSWKMPRGRAHKARGASPPTRVAVIFPH